MRPAQAAQGSLFAAIVLLAVVLLLSGSGALRRIATPTAAAAQRPVRLPLDFVENRGQWPQHVRFAAHHGRLAASFDRHSLSLAVSGASLRLRFLGAARNSVLAGDGRRRARYSFFVGDDPARWRADVHAYPGLHYRGLYSGIDLRVRQARTRLEY